MERDVELKEGITYLSTKSQDEQSRENVSQIQIQKRYIIDIFNSSYMTGDGWCGLEYMYLTPDSFGNTLMEMNYPVTQ